MAYTMCCTCKVSLASILCVQAHNKPYADAIVTVSSQPQHSTGEVSWMTVSRDPIQLTETASGLYGPRRKFKNGHF